MWLQETLLNTLKDTLKAELMNVTTFLLVLNIIAPSKNEFSWFMQFSNV